jgi:hypothetical protein
LKGLPDSKNLTVLIAGTRRVFKAHHYYVTGGYDTESHYGPEILMNGVHFSYRTEEEFIKKLSEIL